MEERVIRETNLPLKLYSRGKVRDTWQLPRQDRLLMVATDRISAFDMIVGVIPGKGKILTQMSEFWFRFFESDIETHFISSDLSLASSHHVWVNSYENDLEGRSMIVKKAGDVIPIECVARGYLAGSGWQEYQKSGTVCGNKLPDGLQEGDKLPEPIFTPATKAEAGQHDENITIVEMIAILNRWLADVLRIDKTAESLTSWFAAKSIEVYKKASEYAETRGIIIADTKFEFGLFDSQPILIDELLTPDSSRFWPAEDWKQGEPQKSFDKQYLRDWLTNEAKWDKKPPVPELPEEVIRVTQEKYHEALRRLIS